MRGGYIDKRRSKIQAWRRYHVAAEDLKKAEKAAKEVDAKLRQAQENVVAAVNKYSKSKVLSFYRRSFNHSFVNLLMDSCIHNCISVSYDIIHS